MPFTDLQVSLRMNEGALERLLNGRDGPVLRYLERTAIRVQAMAVRLCPVDTGRLRSSISYDVGKDARGLLAIVGTNVPYSLFVEFGTRYMAAQPFLRPALAAVTR